MARTACLASGHHRAAGAAGRTGRRMARPSGLAHCVDPLAATGGLPVGGARLSAALRGRPDSRAATARAARGRRRVAARRRLRAARAVEHRERAPPGGSSHRDFLAETRSTRAARAGERRSRRIARFRLPSPHRAPGQCAAARRGAGDRGSDRSDEAPGRRAGLHGRTGRSSVLRDRQPRALHRKRRGMRKTGGTGGDGIAQRLHRLERDAHHRHRRRRGAGPGRRCARPDGSRNRRVRPERVHNPHVPPSGRGRGGRAGRRRSHALRAYPQRPDRALRPDREDATSPASPAVSTSRGWCSTSPPAPGTWGPTMRLGSTNEITVFELSPARAGVPGDRDGAPVHIGRSNRLPTEFPKSTR